MHAYVHVPVNIINYVFLAKSFGKSNTYITEGDIQLDNLLR